MLPCRRDMRPSWSCAATRPPWSVQCTQSHSALHPTVQVVLPASRPSQQSGSQASVFSTGCWDIEEGEEGREGRRDEREEGDEEWREVECRVERRAPLALFRSRKSNFIILGVPNNFPRLGRYLYIQPSDKCIYHIKEQLY